MCMISGLWVVTYVISGWKLVLMPPPPIFQWLSRRFVRVDSGAVWVIGVVGGSDVGGGTLSWARRARSASRFRIWDACTLRGVKRG